MHWRDEYPPMVSHTLDDGRIIDLWPQLYNVKLTISQDPDVEWCQDEW